MNGVTTKLCMHALLAAMTAGATLHVLQQNSASAQAVCQHWSQVYRHASKKQSTGKHTHCTCARRRGLAMAGIDKVLSAQEIEVICSHYTVPKTASMDVVRWTAFLNDMDVIFTKSVRTVCEPPWVSHARTQCLISHRPITGVWQRTQDQQQIKGFNCQFPHAASALYSGLQQVRRYHLPAGVSRDAAPAGSAGYLFTVPQHICWNASSMLQVLMLFFHSAGWNSLPARTCPDTLAPDAALCLYVINAALGEDPAGTGAS